MLTLNQSYHTKHSRHHIEHQKSADHDDEPAGLCSAISDFFVQYMLLSRLSTIITESMVITGINHWSEDISGYSNRRLIPHYFSFSTKGITAFFLTVCPIYVRKRWFRNRRGQRNFSIGSRWHCVATHCVGILRLCGHHWSRFARRPLWSLGRCRRFKLFGRCRIGGFKYHLWWWWRQGEKERCVARNGTETFCLHISCSSLDTRKLGQGSRLRSECQTHLGLFQLPSGLQPRRYPWNIRLIEPADTITLIILFLYPIFNRETYEVRVEFSFGYSGRFPMSPNCCCCQHGVKIEM